MFWKRLTQPAMAWTMSVLTMAIMLIGVALLCILCNWSYKILKYCKLLFNRLLWSFQLYIVYFTIFQCSAILGHWQRPQGCVVLRLDLVSPLARFHNWIIFTIFSYLLRLGFNWTVKHLDGWKSFRVIKNLKVPQ